MHFLQRFRRRSTSPTSNPKHIDSPAAMIPISVPHITKETRALEHDPFHTCQICNEPHLQRRADESIEVPSILPCGHVFGSLCISRWLEVSSFNKDCPACRRTMRYRACGCSVRAIPLEVAPNGFLRLSLLIPDLVKIEDFPEKCWVCRCVEQAYLGQGGELGEKLRMIRERMAVEERALEGLKVLGAPGFFGGSNEVNGNFALRAAESKGYWRGELEKLGTEMVRQNRAW